MNHRQKHHENAVLLNDIMMKKIFILTFGLMSTAVCCAQDLIVKNNGDEIQVKVLSVDEDKVSYKKWSNKNGPTYSLGTDKIFMIKYQNGEKDVFSAKDNGKKSSVADKSSTDGVTGYVEKQPAANNAELIRKYNPEVEFTLEEKGKAHRQLPVLAIEDTSILSNEDIEMNFVKKTVSSSHDVIVLRYYIEITNKTNNIIYIDKGNSFRIIDNAATSFYDNKQISVSKGSGSGASLGLGAITGALGVGGVVGDIAGGVSVGSGTSSSVSTTYTQQRILAIPPHSSAYISEHKYDNYKGNKWEKISEAEYYQVPFQDVEKGKCVEYNTDNSPRKYKYFITYSTYPDFRSYSSINANLYVKYIIGIGRFANWLMKSRFETTLFATGDAIDRQYGKTIPGFSESPIIVGDI